MDLCLHFRREALAFEAAARKVVGDAPVVPSCPEWSMADLVGHLGWVHRYVAHIVAERLQQPPDPSDLAFLGLPADLTGWPMPATAPNTGPMLAEQLDWFAAGADRLASRFEDVDPATPVWTWAPEQTVGFWLRMQTIETALHRWDAENAVGAPQPVDAELATDAIAQNFEVMAPARRARAQAPAGSGERFGFRRTDGPEAWTVLVDGDTVRLSDAGPSDVEVAGTASELMLFLWNRVPAPDHVTGDRAALDRLFTLIPPM